MRQKEPDILNQLLLQRLAYFTSTDARSNPNGFQSR